MARGVDSPEGVVARFYGALSQGDGEVAAGLVTPAKRSSGPFNAARMSKFYGSLKDRLVVHSIRPIDDEAVEVRYSYRASKARCDGTAIVHTERIARATVIQGIRANC